MTHHGHRHAVPLRVSLVGLLSSSVVTLAALPPSPPLLAAAMGKTSALAAPHPRLGVARGGGRTVERAPSLVVYAWGFNQYGELGIGSLNYSNVPVAVPHLVGVVGLAGGGTFSLALRQDGTVWAWGTDDEGELGPIEATCAPRYARFPCSDIPVQVRGLHGITSIAAGQDHALALGRDGTVWVWGDKRTIPARVPDLRGVRAIAAANDENVAIKRDGTVWTWSGTTGDQQDAMNGGSSPRVVPGLIDVVTVAVAGQADMALRQDGTVWAWGGDAWGELGDGRTDNNFHPEPTRVRRLAGVTAITGGGCNGLALTGEGRVWTWGGNDFGQLGNGHSGGDSTTPGPVRRLTHVIAIAAGGWHSLVLRATN